MIVRYIILLIILRLYVGAYEMRGCWNISDVQDELPFHVSTGVILAQNLPAQYCTDSCGLWNERTAGNVFTLKTRCGFLFLNRLYCLFTPC